MGAPWGGVMVARQPDGMLARRLRFKNAQERIFWIGLTGATVLHAVLIFGVASSSPRRMGEQDGDPDALSVDIVDAASLSGGATPVLAEPSEATRPQEPAAEAAPAKQQSTPFTLDKEAMTLFPDPGTDDAAKSSSSAQKHARAPLNLNPPEMPMLGGGYSTSVGRPPNITRSGENDEFGRGVVRALRRTMPSPNGVLGRVKVRIFLSESGNLVDVVLVGSSGDPHLDQSVLFAVKQASFPIPPVGSTSNDRLFLVTYIYNEVPAAQR